MRMNREEQQPATDLRAKRIRFAGWVYLFTGPIVIAAGIGTLVWGRNQRLAEEAGRLLVLPSSTQCYIGGVIALAVGALLWRQGRRKIQK